MKRQSNQDEKLLHEGTLILPPDRAVPNLGASNSADRRILFSSEMLIRRFEASAFAKCWVGFCRCYCCHFGSPSCLRSSANRASSNWGKKKSTSTQTNSDTDFFIIFSFSTFSSFPFFHSGCHLNLSARLHPSVRSSFTVWPNFSRF